MQPTPILPSYVQRLQTASSWWRIAIQLELLFLLFQLLLSTSACSKLEALLAKSFQPDQPAVLSGPPAPPPGPYQWAGVIGTTSDNFSVNPWRGLSFVRSVAYGPAGGIVGVGYGETAENVCTFTDQTRNARVALANNMLSVVDHVDTDGTLYYIASNNNGWDKNNSVYVVARRCSDRELQPFPRGVRANFAGDKAHDNDAGYDGAISLTQKIGGWDPAVVSAQHISGMRVERGNSLLAVCRKNQSTVQFYHKTSGALLSTLRLPAPEKCVFSPSGDFWVITERTVRRYVNRSTRATPAFELQTTITGLQEPVALAMRPNGTLLVQDGGNHQQVKEFQANGQPVGVFPKTPGGNKLSPDVTLSSFLFVNRESLGTQNPGGSDYDKPLGSLDVAPDGSIWLLDAGNYRVMHFSPTWKYLGQFGWLPCHYKIAVDPNNIKRVHSDYMELEVDWTRPIRGGDQTQLAHPTWILKKNWTAQLSRTLSPFLHVVTYTSKGVKRTFAQCHDSDFNKQGWQTEIVELPPAGVARRTGIHIDYGPNTGRNKILYPEGIRWWEITDDGAGNKRQCGYFQPFAGFDRRNNPVFGPVQKKVDFIAQQAKQNNKPLSYGGWNQQDECPVTADGTWISFRAPQMKVGAFQLGGIKPGQTRWAWLALPNKLMTNSQQMVTGFYPAEGSGSDFGGHAGVAVHAVGKYVVCSYDGQNGFFSNQHWLYRQDGKYLGQYGRPSRDQPEFTALNAAPTGYANNTGYSCLLQSGPTLFELTTDEAYFGGIHVHRLEVPAQKLKQ
ncbi:hypothetical protein [Hymenobacter sp.]|uniref:hypothetical protein n=1 Tax=Hymenobacter sp. TaxID=1898978 RepID=UPI002ED9592B